MKLINPSIDSVGDGRFRRGKAPQFTPVEVNESCFDLYMDFLVNKNDLAYNQANMYRR